MAGHMLLNPELQPYLTSHVCVTSKDQQPTHRRVVENEIQIGVSSDRRLRASEGSSRGGQEGNDKLVFIMQRVVNTVVTGYTELDTGSGRGVKQEHKSCLVQHWGTCISRIKSGPKRK